ncbi:MAG: adhesin [Bacteroidetes bacterium]|nr:MAG: adhesin [Bacteroidota bacterium]
MALENRETIKSYFRKGQIPKEGHFVDMVDSMVNKIDDGIDKNIEDGLRLSPIGSSPKLISFFESIEDKSPAWSIEIDKGSSVLTVNNFTGDPVLSLKPDGKVGINTANPTSELDVKGLVAMEGRIGTFAQGKIQADGKWYKILENLSGCHLLEVVAGVGKKQRGKYALIYARAMSTYGDSKSLIAVDQAYYGVRCNQIQLKWTGTTYDYNLEMRSRCDYGGDSLISYYISKLWHDESMEDQ